MRFRSKLKKYGAGKGAWAVVTGASEGIGREYALQLAKKGFNVLVAARNKTALDALVKEIGAHCCNTYIRCSLNCGKQKLRVLV